jgi:AcrR family transcriptional regulator
MTKKPADAIRGAAAVVFARHGFAATRVEDILDEAGVARRTFYKHFANKEEVLAALYAVATGELLAAIRAGLDASDDPLAALRSVLDLYLDYHAAQAPLVAVLARQAIVPDSPLAAPRLRFRDALVKLVDEAVRRATGEANDAIYYVALVSAVEGLSLELLDRGATPPELARAKRAMHRLLDRALPAGAKRRARS